MKLILNSETAQATAEVEGQLQSLLLTILQQVHMRDGDHENIQYQETDMCTLYLHPRMSMISSRAEK